MSGKTKEHYMQAEISFSDKSVLYETFVNDLAAKVTTYLKEDKDDPEYISQNEAFKRFGKGNVTRWYKTNLIRPCKRPGKIEYPLTQLKELSRVKQDYLNRPLNKRK